MSASSTIDGKGASAAFRIAAEDPAQPEIVALLEAGERYMNGLYPAESNHILPVEALRAPSVRFLVARDPTGRAMATGAIALHGDWAEIKRMWVEPAARGHGLARRLLTELEAWAASHGATVLRLETGIHNHDALALYERSGYARRDAFAPYRPDPLSVFMEKRG